jgi:predicted  nucleic acid-binding Zn-ribbon protein
MTTRSKFGKEDDVMLDREIKKVRREIEKLTEWHSNLYKEFSKVRNRFYEHVEKIDDRLKSLEKSWRK